MGSRLKVSRVALAVLAAFVGAYVVYAHVASLRTAREYARENEVESLATEHALRKVGALEPASRGGTIVVEGATGSAPATLEWTAPARRLGEVLVGMRVRTTEADPFEVSIGVEDTKTGQRMGVSIRWDASPTVGLIGANADRRVALDRPRDAHEVSMRISPELHLAAFAIDGVFVGSAATSLDAGSLVRAFHRIDAEAGRHVGVVIESVRVEGLARDAAPLAFVEHFEGQVVDPIRWRLMSADGWTAESHASTSDGLVLEARALRGSGAAMAGVLGPTFSLRSFRASTRVHVDRMKHSSVFFGVTNTHGGLPQWRAFDVGVLDGAEGAQPFCAGHWERDGQNRVQVFAAVDPHDMDAFIEYDAKTGIGRAGIGAKTILEKPLDLEPLEDVQLHFGVNLGAPDADTRIIAREVRFDPW